MNLPDQLKDYCRYNHWANARLTDWLYAKPAELFENTVPSSFPSLRLTLLHIWDAELIWLDRLRGEFAPTFASEHFTGSLDGLRQGLLANSAAFSAFVEGRPDAFFQEKIHYKNTKGDPFTTPNTEVILHCIQHSTYHRGQLVTIARNLGLTDPPSTDYISYVRIRPAVY